MTDENDKRHSRLPEAAGKRAASLNQHLGRKLSNQMRKLEDEQRTSRRILSSEIYQIRAEIMFQQMEKLAMMQGKTSELEILNRNDYSDEEHQIRLTERPQTSPVYSTRNRRGSVLKWAGEPEETTGEITRRSKFRRATAHTDISSSNFNGSFVRNTKRLSNIAQLWQNKERSKSVISYRRPTSSSTRRHSDVPCLRSARVWENRTNQREDNTTKRRNDIILKRRATINVSGFPTIHEEVPININSCSKTPYSHQRRVSSACAKTKWAI